MVEDFCFFSTVPFETPGSGGTLAWGSQGPILPV